MVACLIAGEPGLQRRASVPAVTWPNTFNLGTSGGNRGFGVELAYERALVRRLSAGVALQYAFPPQGVWHLQAFGERVYLAVWPWQVGQGFFGRGSFGVRHQVFARDATIRSTTLAPGLDAGWRWRLRHGFNVGLFAGLQWLARVQHDSRICTRPAHCPATDPGVQVGGGLDVGYSF